MIPTVFCRENAVIFAAILRVAKVSPPRFKLEKSILRRYFWGRLAFRAASIRKTPLGELRRTSRRQVSG
jgi:hypothetical protein